jgi:hydroxymethylbilane synthase
LKRLGRVDAATAILSTDQMLPAVAQGAIGIEIRKNDAPLTALVAAINHAPTVTAVTAERAMLAVLDGSSRTPIAAYAEIYGTALRLRGLIALPDGTESHRAEDTGNATMDGAAALGRALGERLKALAGPDFLA